MLHTSIMPMLHVMDGYCVACDGYPPRDLSLFVTESEGAYPSGDRQSHAEQVSTIHTSRVNRFPHLGHGFLSCPRFFFSADRHEGHSPPRTSGTERKTTPHLLQIRSSYSFAGLHIWSHLRLILGQDVLCCPLPHSTQRNCSSQESVHLRFPLVGSNGGHQEAKGNPPNQRRVPDLWTCCVSRPTHLLHTIPPFWHVVCSRANAHARIYARTHPFSEGGNIRLCETPLIRQVFPCNERLTTL